MRFLGLDPGMGGGLAVLEPDGKIAYLQKFEGLTTAKLGEILFEASALAGFALLEKVTPSPPQTGAARRSGTKSMFSFGKNVGHLEMGLALSGIRWEEVSPASWQKGFGLYGQGETTRTKKKNHHKDLAEKLFPGVKITHAIADALLIAEFARRTRR